MGRGHHPSQIASWGGFEVTVLDWILGRRARSSVGHGMEYRADIDGLRAIAVLPVVLFHAGSGFSGGYVGVDIFFVISGFLITQVLLRDWEKGTFSIATFYERRVRRILPALFVVIAFCIVGSWILLIPQDMRDFSLSVVAAVTFVSNFLFYQQSDYFSTAAHYKPLLHTWSLAVEEQFYILFPPALWFCLKYARRWLPFLIVVSIILSFGLSQYAVWRKPDAAFYLSPFRIWELLIGCFLALDVMGNITSKALREVVAAAGLASIAYAVFFYTAETPFPGVAALLPCLGAAALIYANTRGRTIVGSVLSSGPLVGIGLISYSLYLWHWPLLAFARVALMRSLTPAEGLAIAGLSFVIAILSLRYVERPFRAPQAWKRRPLFVLSGAVAALLVMIGAFGYLSNGVPSRFDDKVIAMTRFAYSTEVRDWLRARNLSQCFLRTDVDADTVRQCMSPAKDGKTVLVWGDSHAAHAYPGISDYAEKQGYAIRLIAMRGCSPQLEGGFSKECDAFNRIVADEISRHRYATVIALGHWFNPQARWRVQSLIEPKLNSLAEAGVFVAKTGAQFVVVGPMPEYDEPLPVLLARQIAWKNQHYN